LLDFREKGDEAACSCKAGGIVSACLTASETRALLGDESLDDDRVLADNSGADNEAILGLVAFPDTGFGIGDRACAEAFGLVDAA